MLAIKSQAIEPREVLRHIIGIEQSGNKSQFKEMFVIAINNEIQIMQRIWTLQSQWQSYVPKQRLGA